MQVQVHVACVAAPVVSFLILGQGLGRVAHPAGWGFCVGGSFYGLLSDEAVRARFCMEGDHET